MLPKPDTLGGETAPGLAIAARARALGFSAVGFADARDPALAQAALHLEQFLGSGHHGTMSWLADTQQRRALPTAMWDGARSAIVVGLNYGPTHDPLAILDEPAKAAISVYAQGRDYHDIIKGKLKELARFVAKTIGGEVKVFVDTAPLMEKPLAQLAGIGWQGKHTNLVSREFGSWLFLGVVLSSADIAADGREGDHCGQCRACLDICPTNAFPAPYQLDARRCISYLTIEHKGTIDAGLRAKMGNRIYGCDDCLAVCPWNKFAQQGAEAKLAARADLVAPDLARLATLDDAAFRKLFSGSPIKRIGRDRFLRNVAIAVGNSRDAALVPVAVALSHDASALVRAMGAWALKQLLDPNDFAALAATRIAVETDKDVRTEWA